MKTAQCQLRKRFLIRGLPLVIAMMLLGCAQSALGQWASPSPNPDNNIYYNSGNVGIGTTNPVFKLTLQQDSTTSQQLALQNDTTSAGRYSEILFAHSNGAGKAGIRGYAVNLNSNNETQLRFFTSPSSNSPTERMTIDQAGNVGIGTTSPGNLFHVSRSLSADTDLLKLEDTNLNSNLVGLVFKSVSGSTAALRAKYTNPASTTATELQFYTNPVGGNNNLTQRMVIDGSGNVGIGTTGPANKLHIATTTDADGLVVSNSTTVNGTRAAIYLSTLNATPALGNVSVEAISVASAYPDMVFRTSGVSAVNAIGTERMRITSNGNVGIGMPTPGARLEIGGGPGYGLIINAGNSGSLRWGNGAQAALSWDTGKALVYGLSGNDLGLGAGGAFDQLIIKSSGNVGIATGTTGPTERLEVNGNLKLSGTGNLTAAGTIDAIGGLKINGSSITGSQWTTSGSAINYAAGNVGIGVTSPGKPLTVQASSGANAIAINGRSDDYGYLEFFRNDGTTLSGAIYSKTDRVTITDASSTDVLTVKAGSVGIGTPSPSTKLHVQGDGKFTGNLTVDGNINAKYQDVAEWVPSSEQLAAGTVVVLDSTKSNQVISSSVSYDTRVAGVISAQPGIALGEKSDSKVLVATTGRVKVKVDASKGPIHIGDLLVTSDVQGMAMKSEPIMIGGRQIHGPGTLIGKALEPLATGKGEILVLLSLQ